MKRLLLVLFVTFLCLYALVSSAQPKAGFKGGLNVSQLSGFEGSSRVSIHAGVFVQYSLKSNWRFQPELLYTGEGQHYFDNEVERTLALGYVQLPLMFGYSPARQFYIEAGPQFGVLVHAMSKGSNADKLNVKRSIENTAFAMNVGLGLHINERIGLYARYSFGLTDITLFGSSNSRSQVGQAGISLRLK